MVQKLKPQVQQPEISVIMMDELATKFPLLQGTWVGLGRDGLTGTPFVNVVKIENDGTDSGCLSWNAEAHEVSDEIREKLKPKPAEKAATEEGANSRDVVKDSTGASILLAQAKSEGWMKLRWETGCLKFVREPNGSSKYPTYDLF